jgi:hypothetical protein
MIEFYGGYQVYSESGVDLTMLRENLKVTPTERLKRHCNSLPIYDLFAAATPNLSTSVPRPRRSPMLDLPALIKQLTDHDVDFVLIGGLAMIAHGSAYITKDLDICYSRTPVSVAALVHALGTLHPRLRGAPADLPFRFDPPTIQAGLNFTLTTDLGDVDVLGEIAGIGRYEQALANSVEKVIEDVKVRVLTIDGLIAAKKAAGRTKDKLHLLELEELKKLSEAQN